METFDLIFYDAKLPTLWQIHCFLLQGFHGNRIYTPGVLNSIRIPKSFIQQRREAIVLATMSDGNPVPGPLVHYNIFADFAQYSRDEGWVPKLRILVSSHRVGKDSPT